jgi:hypothetical protein
MSINLPLISGIFNWRDIIEIIFFSVIMYSISLWLKKDTQKNLLLPFYGFCVLLIGSYFLNLPAIHQLLFMFCPAIILLFMFMHQNTLQRNFIALKNITTPSLLPSSDWVTMLMRSCLTMLHNNQEILLIIEHTDAMGAYLKADYYINAPFTNDLLMLLVNKVYDTQKMIWVCSDGTIRGINVLWKASWHPSAYDQLNAWVDDAIAHTSKNDAVILHINPLKQYCSIASNGTLYQELTIEQAHQLLRKKINHPIPATKKGYPYDVTNKKNNVAQHIP